MPMSSSGAGAEAVQHRPLGRSGLRVSAIGLGTAPLGDLYARLAEPVAVGTAVAALRGGVTLVDTSPHYGNGLSELRCSSALREAGHPGVVLSTKVGRVMDPRTAPPPREEKAGAVSPGFAGGLPHAARFDYSFDGVMRSFEQSLLRLGTGRIDILLIHDVDAWTHGEAAIEARFREAMAGAYRALDRLRGEGVVRAIGVGLNDAAMCARFAREGDFDTMLLAGRYSLLEQPALDEFLPLAQEKGIGVMLGGVFNSGILATGAVPGARYNYVAAPPEVLARVARIEAACRAHGATLPAAALHFALAHPAVSSVVLGAVTPEEVERNLALAATAPPAGLWAELKAAGLLRAQAPVPA
jgi:D-threo-aldose 1-dehydrogenase